MLPKKEACLNILLKQRLMEQFMPPKLMSPKLIQHKLILQIKMHLK